MTIMKLDREESPWEAVPRETVHLLSKSDALALWIYLFCKPAGWEIRREEICDHFGWGEHKYRNAMKTLRDYWLLHTKTERSADGRITGRTLIILARPKNPHRGETPLKKNSTEENPTAYIRREKDIREERKTDICAAQPHDDLESQTRTTKSAQMKAEAIEVLDLLNAKSGRNFPPVASNINMILSRMREVSKLPMCSNGRTPGDIVRQVVALKCREWEGNPDMEGYRRPKTLFAAKNFATYLGELGVQKPTRGLEDRTVAAQRNVMWG